MGNRLPGHGQDGEATLDEATEEDLEKANNQLNELLKDLSLGLMTVIPFAPITIPMIAKFAKKYDIDLLPEWFKDTLK